MNTSWFGRLLILISLCVPGNLVLMTAPALAVDCVYVAARKATECQPGADLAITRLVQASHATSEAVRVRLMQQYFAIGAGQEIAPILNYATQSDEETADGVFAGFVEQPQTSVPTHSAWGDLGGIYSNRTSATSGFEGAMFSGSFGVDRQVGEGGVIGLFGGLETSYYDTTSATGTGFLRGKGFSTGVYAGQLLGDNVFANTTLGYRQIDNSFEIGATGATYLSRSLNASANLTGYYQFDYLRVSPKAGIGLSHEWRDGYTETSGAVSLAQETTSGSTSAGIEAGYTFVSADGRTVEPWVSANLEWLFLDTSAPAPPPSPDPLNAVDVRLGAGINAAISDSVSLSVRGDVSGLTTPNYIVVSAGGQLSVRF